MKRLVFIPLIIVNNFFAFGQNLSCEDFKEGVFQFEGINHGYYTVIRNESVQFERNTKMAQYSTMTIRWDSECSYTLLDFIGHESGKEPKRDQRISELKNIIYKIEEPNKFYVKTYLEDHAETIETVFYKIDTTKYYNNLFQLKAFTEYTNSKSYGQTIVGEIYSISYYQSNKENNKYILVFETSFQTENHHKSALLDSKIVQIKNGENITNSNCRYNDEYDDEISAIYTSENEHEEAHIIKAYRFNREKKQIEEVDKSKVRYKVSDRMRIKL